ncbi:hypothetical protein MCHI_000670 [Candidatus Magnetoovum chiemensis]|nr:hypothetical protein MCHI_000670 [Candidatus Magnetoovum chiemensis]
MSEDKVNKEGSSNNKQENMFKRFLNWIAKGAKKASEIGASCGS